MTNTEALILSAKACAPEYLMHNGDDVRVMSSWNPPENPEQNWMCVKELLQMGYDVDYKSRKIAHTIYRDDIGELAFFCPPERFAMLALAEVTKDE